MNDLVRELQLDILDILVPSSQRNDRFERLQAVDRQRIANVWYNWIQELFCDAVGLTMAGPCYLYAFSSYLASLEVEDFYQLPEELCISTHPIKWLRIHFLAQRGEILGISSISRSIEAEWNQVAQAMGIVEDYHGYYDRALEEVVTRTIEDMLVEADPREFELLEGNGGSWTPENDSPIQLLNWAWQIQLENPEAYNTWEAELIGKLLQTSLPA